MRILVLNGVEQASSAGQKSDPAWDIENRLKEAYPRVTFEFYQPQDERAIVDALRRGLDVGTGGVLLNGAVWAFPSRAVLDAVAALSVPVIAVRAANVPGNADIAAACTGVITGLGLRGYELAMEYLLDPKEE